MSASTQRLRLAYADTVWRHFKGTTYRIFAFARRASDLEVVVLYGEPHLGLDGLFERTWAEFNDHLVDHRWTDGAGVEHTYTGPRYVRLDTDQRAGVGPA